jgi:hypothetical protein
MKTSINLSLINCLAMSILMAGILTACGAGTVDPSASNVSIAVPKSSVIATSSSKASSKAASAAASSIPAGAIVSTAAKTSHRLGEDCLTCHRVGGTAPANATFTVAGSVYSGNSGAVGASVMLYMPTTMALTTTMITDKTGNFYSTLSVYNPMVGANTKVGNNSMGGLVVNGSCNGCHSPVGGTGRIN